MNERTTTRRGDTCRNEEKYFVKPKNSSVVCWIMRIHLPHTIIHILVHVHLHNNNIASTDILTASYDHTMKMWDLRHMRGKPTAEFSGV